MALPPNVVTLVDLVEYSARSYGPRELFGTRTAQGWVYTSYSEVQTLVDRLRGGLAGLGVSRGDRVGIIANNRVEWAIAAYATYGLAAAFVPMYESQLEKDWAFILRDSGAKILFVSSQAIYDKVKDFPATIPTLQHIVLLSGDAPVLTYAALLDKGTLSKVPSVHPDPGALASLIYTSGTTGDPKGVLLSHNNVMSNVRAVQEDLPFGGADRSLSFLPWAHSFGHTAELHLMVSVGASMAICESTDKIISYLPEVKPTVLFTVPRIFNRIYAGVQKQMQTKPAPVRALFSAGLRLAKRKNSGQSLRLVERLILALADRVVFAKVRGRFGGRLKYAVSGAAALDIEVAEFIDALGIKVYEGYGLTETSPIVSCNVPGAHKVGSVGRPFPGVRVIIDKALSGDPKSGEIVVYGPNVMQGYYQHPEETRSAFTADGGFRTGDLGYLDDDGFLYITGRIKEQYKLENGKFVVPGPLEEKLKLSPFIANVMIYGDNKPFNVAVVALNFETLKEWAAKEGLAGGEKELLKNEKVRVKMKEEIDGHSSGFKGYERIRAFALVEEDFTQQNDMLTPKLSVKRRKVMDRWGKQILALYDA